MRPERRDKKFPGGKPDARRSDGTRILFLPEADSPSTSERTPALLNILRRRYPVAALRAPRDRLVYDPKRPLAPRLVLYCIDKILLAAHGLSLAHRFRANVVFCESVHHVIAGIIIARILNVRCVWDSHGNGRLFLKSLGKGPVSVRLMAALETFLGKRVDNLITVSEADAAAYEGMGVPRAKIHVIPLCVNVAEIDSAVAEGPPFPRTEGIPVLVFFGSFGYAPNRGALAFINSYLAPSLERNHVRCEIWIAGRDMPAGDYHPFVRPLGFVPNIYSCIDKADVSIVPVRQGVGVLTKVIDSMAVGTPLVVFDFAAAGIPALRHRVHAYIASNDSEFLSYVLEALSQPKAAQAISRRARQLAERRHDWRVHASKLDVILSGAPRPSTGGESW